MCEGLRESRAGGEGTELQGFGGLDRWVYPRKLNSFLNSRGWQALISHFKRSCSGWSVDGGGSGGQVGKQGGGGGGGCHPPGRGRPWFARRVVVKGAGI